MAIFKKQSPHENYTQQLKNAGLDRTGMGAAWIQNSNAIADKALSITLPYKETGYFSADKVQVAAFRFEAKRGQKIHLLLSKKPVSGFDIYTDIMQVNGLNEHKVVASADTNGTKLDYEVDKTGQYLLRLQPELLRGGEYTLTISTGPSLNFPVSSAGKPSIGSFWGDGRDQGVRKHEGVDIFAVKLTPAIAAANGVVTSVRENTLGGLVVFMRPDGKDYNLYYAHLDKQLVAAGKTVKTGDTLGLIGNTGNARYTPAHLHFGIYTSDGAIDPLVFIDRTVRTPQPVTAPLALLNATARTANKNARLYTSLGEDQKSYETLPVSTALSITAATTGWYKATLPDGRQGFISSQSITAASTLRKLILQQHQALLDYPDTAIAAKKLTLTSGAQLNIKGSFGNYYLVTDNHENSGWIQVSK